MSEFFLDIVNMSISASWLVLAVLVLRFLLKKAPKWVNVLLWGIVAIRLICPVTIESALSLIPSRETISPEIMMDLHVLFPEASTELFDIHTVLVLAVYHDAVGTCSNICESPFQSIFDRLAGYEVIYFLS